MNWRASALAIEMDLMNAFSNGSANHPGQPAPPRPIWWRVAHRAARLGRQLVFPRGSRRDKFWALRIRPVVKAVLGIERKEAPMPARVVTLSSPIAKLGPGERIRSILMVKVDHIGDLLLALPAIAELRRHFPDASLTLMCGRWNVGLARGFGVFDQVIPIDFFPGKADAARRPVFDPRELGKLDLPIYDLAIDLRIDEDTRIILDSISARFKAGFYSRYMPADMTIVLPEERIDKAAIDDPLQHQRMLMLKLVNVITAYFDPFSDSRVLLSRVTAPHEAEARTVLEGLRGPIIAVNPSSGRAIKNWPIENYLSVCRWIVGELGGSVVLIGGPKDRADAQVIARRIGGRYVRNLAGQLPLDKSLALLGAVDLYLANDSGLTHAAATLGVPTVAIYSGIDPISMWLPIGPRVAALKADVPCSPCHLIHVTDCWRGHACLRAISVNTVRLTVERMLVEGRGAVASLPAEPAVPRLT